MDNIWSLGTLTFGNFGNFGYFEHPLTEIEMVQCSVTCNVPLKPCLILCRNELSA